MAKRRTTRGRKLPRLFLAIAAACILLVSALISFFPQLGLPSWEEIFRAAGLNETVSASEYPFSVHYIDVGQADCSLVVCGDDAVLIDAGDVDAYRTIDAYLQSQGITSLRYLILTHAHADHIGSADEVLENYAVENVIMPRYTEENTPTTAVYEDLLYALNASGANVIAAQPGNVYTLTEFSFTVLAPNRDYTELNDTSVVVRAVYEDTAFLFQGDAETPSEEDILKTGLPVQAEVIKLGHHGSKTASSEAYLRAVSPTLAVIPCGEGNSYNLPSTEILERLDATGIDYRRTDRNGTIVVTSDGARVGVQTEKRYAVLDRRPFGREFSRTGDAAGQFCPRLASVFFGRFGTRGGCLSAEYRRKFLDFAGGDRKKAEKTGSNPEKNL